MTSEHGSQSTTGDSESQSLSRSRPTQIEPRGLLQMLRTPPAFGIVICLAGLGALSIFYHLAIFFIHPDVALWLCVVFASTGVVLALRRARKSLKEVENSKSDVLNTESRQHRLWMTAKPWIVLVITLCVGVPLIRSMGAGAANDRAERSAFVIVMAGIYLAVWMLTSHLARYFTLSPKVGSTLPPETFTPAWRQDWKAAPWWAIAFFVFASASPQGGQSPRNRNQQKEIGMVPFSKGAMPRSINKRDAAIAYWRSAVAKLHLVRFQHPSGDEPAEKYYERTFQQLRLLTVAAKQASTIDVDADLVQMVERHLAIEDEVLQLKNQLDDFMKTENLAQPTDTIDQRMAFAELLVGSLEVAPDTVEKISSGPIREFLKKGLWIEDQRQQQFREIELMQAALQERYKGSLFALPTIAP